MKPLRRKLIYILLLLVLTLLVGCSEVDDDRYYAPDDEVESDEFPISEETPSIYEIQKFFASSITSINGRFSSWVIFVFSLNSE